MVATPSVMLPLGTQVPAFSLEDPRTGKKVGPEDYAGRPLLVAFICNHCPYVIHLRKELIAFAHEYLDKGLAVIAINANSETSHPQDGPPHMKALAEEEGWRFPFVFDRTQSVAQAFQAACTPDFFLFDRNHCLSYRGQFDDSRPSKDAPVTGRDLRAATDAVLAGQQPSQDQRPSMGCNIKWDAR